MIQCKIKDNSQILKGDLASIETLTKRIADRTLEQLERDGVFVFPDLLKESDDLSNEQMILQSYNDVYKTSNVMGFLGVGNERLLIKSRFSTEDNDYLFQYLLEKVFDFPNIIDMKNDSNHDQQLYDLLLFLFPYYLKTAMRKGLFKTYIKKDYNNYNLKGNLDVARHIRKNTPFIGKIAYRQREYSFDNNVIELIRHTIEHVKKKTYGKKLLNSVKDEVKLIVNETIDYNAADKKKIIDANKKNVIRHAYYHEYRALQQLCILILQNQKQQFGTGTRKVYGILFDGAWLWEEYVNSIIKDEFYHPMNKAGKGHQWLFEGNRGLIYPDFISKNKDNRLIADAKYKPVNNICNKDYLQVLAYMFRFDAKKGFYLYPETEDTSDVILRVNQGSSYENNVCAREDVNIIKHGLKIPKDARNYKDFVLKIKENEVEFKKRLLL